MNNLGGLAGRDGGDGSRSSSSSSVSVINRAGRPSIMMILSFLPAESTFCPGEKTDESAHENQEEDSEAR